MNKLTAALAALAATVALTGAPAAADHLHVIRHKDGSCTVLAKNGGERFVELPNVDPALPANRRHPLHVKVHTGRPGERGNIFVLGTVPCSSYRNR